MDTDSPNLPAMFSKYGGVYLDADRKFVPVIIDDMPVVSTGLMSSNISSAFKIGEENRQIIRDMVMQTLWGEIDILIADCPAGSSDEMAAFINTVGKENIVGVVAVTLPSTLDDLKRSVDIFSRLGIRIIGVVENERGVMTTCGYEPICPECGNMLKLFMTDNAVFEYVKSVGLQYITSIPIIEAFIPGKGTFPYLPDIVLNNFIMFFDEYMRLYLEAT